MKIEGIEITADFDATREELANYVAYVKERVATPLKSITVKLYPDGYVDVDYKARGEKFERIRRITGYLTGDLSVWNDSKQAEERERVKHEVRV